LSYLIHFVFFLNALCTFYVLLKCRIYISCFPELSFINFILLNYRLDVLCFAWDKT
jgi:hypothetical protein